MNIKLLPVGSVVKLKTSSLVQMMISGYYPVDSEKEVLYEYQGLLYPQGMLSEKSFLLFDSEDIEEIIYEGYSDEEGDVIREMLPMVIREAAKENN